MTTIEAAEARADNSFSADEMTVIRTTARRLIEEVKIDNPAGIAWFGSHLEQLAGRSRARRLLGDRMAAKVYG